MKHKILAWLICFGVLLPCLLTGCAPQSTDSFYHTDTIISGEGHLSTDTAQSSGNSLSSQANSSSSDEQSSSVEESSPSYPAEFPSADSQVDFGSTVSGSGGQSSSSDKSSLPASEGEENDTSSSAADGGESGSSGASGGSGGTAVTGERRAAWITYLEYANILKGKSKSTFQANINAVFDNCVSQGLNTVIVQVRPFGDALYDSDYFPWSSYASGTEGVNPGFDPLQVMVESARARGLRIEAWINPYRIRTGSNTALSDDNPASKWLAEGSDCVVKTSSGLYYNPAREEVQQLVVNGVAELVRNYDIDAIHFDDYFYPNPDDSFDNTAYQEYRNAGGTLSRGDWRRENVNKLVRTVYATIKSIDSSVELGISPQCNMSNNYNQQYIDVAKWLSNTGYVDYIAPQLYVGFENATAPFAQTVAEWNSMIQVSGIDLYVGLAVYKIGQTDTWAGSGKNEWLNVTDMLQRQVETSREQSHYQGFILYRYDSFANPTSDVKSQVAQEMANLRSILQ